MAADHPYEMKLQCAAGKGHLWIIIESRFERERSSVAFATKAEAEQDGARAMAEMVAKWRASRLTVA